MTLNDAHVFCTPEQIQEETVKVLKMIKKVYDDFGLTDYWYRLSLGDPKNTESFVDKPELWQKAEALLVKALEETRNSEFAKIHYIDADTPEECVLLHAYAFHGVQLGFEIMPGTKGPAPKEDLNDYEVGPVDLHGE